MRAVWGDTAIEEANLSYHVFAIRKALVGRANGRVIEMVPKLGYRFRATVEQMNGTMAAVKPLESHADNDRVARVPAPVADHRSAALRSVTTIGFIGGLTIFKLQV